MPDVMGERVILNVVYGTWHRLTKGGVATGCGKDTSRRLNEWVVADELPAHARLVTTCKRCYPR